MKIAVTGVNGFVGVHLARDLIEHDHQVVGLGKGPINPDVADLTSHYVEHDLTQGWPADQVGDIDAVIHLAGLSAVGPSFADPQRYLEANSAPITHLGEHLVATKSPARVISVSTGAVYSPGIGITEQSPTEANSPYALSKLLVETQCAYYRRRGLDVVVMRPFNHIGPGQQTGFLLPDLVDGVRRGDLVVGNLETRRDYTDVRDVARAYRLAVEATNELPPILNVCAGVSVSGRELLERVSVGLGVELPHVTIDPARLRPADPQEISGDHDLITRVLGWRPRTTLDETVRDFLQVQPRT